MAVSMIALLSLKALARQLLIFFTMVFTCLCPSIPGAQEIDNVPLDIFAILGRV